MAKAKPVLFYLHSMHEWSDEEANTIMETANRIGDQNKCRIIHMKAENAFSIEGADVMLQRQALEALSELLDRIMPKKNPLLPSTPFRDFMSVGSLVDVGNLTAALPALTNGAATAPPEDVTRATLEFRVHQKIRAPYDMYYMDKTQRTSLPVMIAEDCRCEATISEDGRVVEISGDRVENVRLCITRLEGVQEYFLRAPFRLDKVALVYAQARNEFRLIFVPVADHLYFSRNIDYLPSDVSELKPRSFCVAEMGVFDPERRKWVLRNGVKQPLRSSEPVPQSPVHEAPRSNAPQHPMGRGSQPVEPPTRPPAQRHSSGRSGGLEWHEQENPPFGFNVGGPARRQSQPQPTATMSWGPGRPSQSSGSTWPAPGSSSGKKVLPPAQGTTRRLEEREWSSAGYDATGGGDNEFPSLSASSSKSAGKKVGVPSLPPVRKVDSQTSGNMAGSPGGFYSPTESPSRASNGGYEYVDSDFEYLESITSSASRQWERDRDEHDPPRLRDAQREREDGHRVIQTLPRLQASPSQQNGQSAFVNAIKAFNMKRLSESIWNGMSELRGQRKEIRLIGRLGSALYPLDPIFKDKAWEYTELEKLIAGSARLRPVFSPIATTNADVASKFHRTLGELKSKTAHFEIMCGSRTNPQSKFTPTVIIVPSTQAVLERVVTPWETYGDVIWDAVDRHLDFQILLQAREGVVRDTKSALGRTDVKPFNTFRKKLSIGTYNSHITCYNIKEMGAKDKVYKTYLQVHNILLRESGTYERQGFTIVLHQVKQLNIVQLPGLDAVRADVDESAKVWFEVEVFNAEVNQKLQANQELIGGTVADWKVSDLLGDDPTSSDELWKLVRELMNRSEDYDRYMTGN
ncbi:MAG: hypothetical protein J3Q66DRAFT_356768 [Benniella sp.]|nr:MAG: hypothetical protein J3Q66DRAFT_356768 [Benniella sp.]